MSESNPAHTASGTAGKLSRRTLIVAMLAVAAIISSAWWVYDRVTHVHITDARIAGTMITISSRVHGWLDELPIETGDRVRRGDLLLAIDEREAALALEEAELRMAVARAELRRIQAERSWREASLAAADQKAAADLRAAQSEATAAEVELEQAEADWNRARSLLERDMISRELFDQQRSFWRQAEQRSLSANARVEAAQAAVAAAEAAKAELIVFDARELQAEAAVEDARAQRDQLEIALSHHRIVSPVDGVIDTVFLEAGEYVERGRQLLMLHNPDDLWVSANVRETHIRHLQPGDRARIRVDAYPGLELEGEIRRIGQATTSQFALLPNPNPSGNFTKITQRIEVRIDLEPSADVQLKPGMMVEVKIGI